ncbi:MAG: hypothetical protein V1663_02400, partial [archaeon]
MPDKKVEEILRKHGARIEEQINSSDFGKFDFSREYVKFKEEMAPELTRFERWCKSLGSLIKLKISEKDDKKIRRELEIAHLDIEPWQALTLSIVVFVSVFV